MTQIIKIALTGNTGVGKDTFIQNLSKLKFVQNFKEIKLSSPFYVVQELVYKICGVEKDYFIQDGELLNFLGSHMRKINPNVLKLYFLEQLKQINPGYSLVVCSDARPADLDFLREEKFLIIQILSDKKLSLERRILRGDISLSNFDDVTEKKDKELLADYQIVNNGTLNEYENNIYKLIGNIYDTHRKRN
jgi:cytidine deaminase